MSKKIRLRALALVTCLSILAPLLANSPASALQNRSAAVVIAPSNEKNAAVVAATASVLRETSEIRQLAILRPVKSGAQTRGEIERMIVKNLDEDTTPAELRASELAMIKLGLVPATFQYRNFLVQLLTEQVAGYYDPKVQQFYLADWINLDGQKPVMAHELTHALQDQHFNLRRFENWAEGDSDAELAAHALIEGDATLAMMFYVARNPLRRLAMMRSIQGAPSNTDQIERAPRVLRESLLFPYIVGADWAMQLYQRGGWARVSQAFTDLPQSTEQILHAEKYFAHEAPVKVNMPNVASTLGAGWKRIDYDVNGEWSLYLILDEFLKSEKDSRQAAAGWGGDRYAVYTGSKTGELFIAQLSAWDTEGDAREFFESYAKRTRLRYGNAAITEFALPGSTGERRAWHTNEGDVVMELRSSRVLVLEGVPARADKTALLKKLWN